MNSIESISPHPLFKNMDAAEIKTILSCFSFQEKRYRKDEYIILEGDMIKQIGIILHGVILMEKNDFWGNNYFFTELREHEIFAEPFMGVSIQSSSVNYKAMTNCSILFFQYKDMWRPCGKNCRCHSLFTENLMNLLALKTRTLLAKIEILSKKSLRDRILTFLNTIKNQQDIVGIHSSLHIREGLSENEVFIPFNRTELAEYLGVNRSALVRELSRMKSDGIIDFNKNLFRLLS